jgi:hypothetical protein
MPQDPNSMAALAAILQGGGGAPPGGPPGGGMPPGIDPSALGGGDPMAGLLGGGPAEGAEGEGQQGSDLLSGMNSTDHIRAAIKHLMMAMTNTQDDQQGHGIAKGMAALHGILAGDQKNKQTIANAGG